MLFHFILLKSKISIEKFHIKKNVPNTRLNMSVVEVGMEAVDRCGSRGQVRGPWAGVGAVDHTRTTQQLTRT